MFCGADLELVTRDGDDKHAEEDRLHSEEDAVQDAGLLQPDVLGETGNRIMKIQDHDNGNVTLGQSGQSVHHQVQITRDIAYADKIPTYLREKQYVHFVFQLGM